MQKTLVALLLSLALVYPARAQDAEDQADDENPATDFRSPDGRFAFRFGKDEAEGEEIRTFDLIDAASGKMLVRIAKTEPDPAPSSRFGMRILWRPDSKAFALTETLWKRGSDVLVYRLNGVKFKEVALPTMEAEITEKAKHGKKFAKTTEINSEEAKRWQKDGSLVVDVQTREDGEDGSITATRTFVLGFNRSDKARVLKSSIKFAIEKEE